MTEQILNLDFKFHVSRDEYEKAMAAVAPSFANVPGLRWKVWLMNEARREAGGVYLFDDEASVESFLQGELATAVKSHPALSDLNVKQFEAVEGLSKVTRGPL